MVLALCAGACLSMSACGKMAAEILLGNKTPADIEVATLTPAVSYNKELCTKLGIEIPKA